MTVIHLAGLIGKRKQENYKDLWRNRNVQQAHACRKNKNWTKILKLDRIENYFYNLTMKNILAILQSDNGVNVRFTKSYELL